MARPALGPEQFTEAFARHGRALWVLAAAWVGRDDAADLVQETARVAWQQRQRFAVGSDLRAWLAQIARHVGANWRRRRRPVAIDPAQLPEPPAADARRFEPGRIDVDALDLPDELAAGLAALPEVARACLLLHVVMELPFAEIATMLDIPENTASSHAHRARRRLLETMTAAGAAPQTR